MTEDELARMKARAEEVFTWRPVIEPPASGWYAVACEASKDVLALVAEVAALRAAA